MVAILATTGRFSLRTTGRAVMSLTVREACGMGSTRGSVFDRALFQPGRCRCKFTNEYTLTRSLHAPFRGSDT
jgi:hypothetical protein